MKEKLAVAILPIGMLLVVVVSMLNYPIEVIEEVFEYLNEKQVAATVQITTDETQEAATVIEALVQEVSVSETPVESAQVQTEPLYTKVYQKVITIRDKVELKLNDISFKNMYVCLHTAVHSVLSSTGVYADSGQTVVLLENGYLTSVRAEEFDVKQYAENLIVLNEYLEEKGTDMLYIQAPYKISAYDDQLPFGVEDTHNEAADSLLEQLSGSVDYIDMREKMYQSGLDQYDYFFVTDHHWLPEAGFWAFGEIAQVLNSDYGFAIDEELADIEQYNIDVYEDWFLGSWGKRVGPYLAGVDDISIITPTFETSLHIVIEDENIDASGSFEDVMFNYDLLDDVDYWNENPYQAYICAVEPFISITNEMAETSKKILIVQDSFGRVVTPYLALGCSQVDVIDLRYYKEMSLLEYLESNEYDMVLFVYNPSGLENENCFVFDKVAE